MLNIQAHKTNPHKLQNQSKQLICIYRNESTVIQIVRISQPNSNFFEKSVLPNQYIHFDTSINALLEVYEGIMSGLVHADTIPCYQLAINTEVDRLQKLANVKRNNHELAKFSQDILPVAS